MKMEDEEFEKKFMELANKYEDYFYFLNEEYNKDGIKQAKDCVKQILEEIERNAIKKAPRHDLQVELFEVDEPF